MCWANDRTNDSPPRRRVWKRVWPEGLTLNQRVAPERRSGACSELHIVRRRRVNTAVPRLKSDLAYNRNLDNAIFLIRRKQEA